MGFKEAVCSVYSNYATFRGRATRSEYWYFVLFCVLVAFVAVFIGVAIGLGTGGYGEGTVGAGVCALLMIVFYIVSFLPSLALSVRRLHDIGKSGWYILIGFIPYIGGIVMFIFALMKSAPDNRYGPNPLGEAD